MFSVFSFNSFSQSDTLNIQFFGNGNVKESYIKNDKVINYTKYLSNGQVKESGQFYIDGDGNTHRNSKWVSYWDNGQKTMTGYYHLGKKCCTWNHWDHEGRLIAEVMYGENGLEEGYMWDEEKGLMVKE